MRDDICTIPVSEAFEEKDGCPICLMRDTIEERILNYILGDAMMEPDVRIETNKVGFCKEHYQKMLSRRSRLQLSLMLQTHIEEINDGIFKNKLLNADGRKKAEAKKVTESCFVCDKIEWGISRMIDTVYRCYETEPEFRELFNSQKFFCLPHYERLLKGADKRKMKKHYNEFSNNLTKLTGDHCKKLYEDISKYCSMYDYRSNPQDNWEGTKDSVERTIAFLTGNKE